MPRGRGFAYCPLGLAAEETRIASALPRINIAILEDYQGVALTMADWSPVLARAHVDVFDDHFAEADAVVERLLPYDVVCVMRERTPLNRGILERFPRLKLIASTGGRNTSIDLAAAGERGIAVANYLLKFVALRPAASSSRRHRVPVGRVAMHRTHAATASSA